MPRLRNTKSGAIISVADEKVARMGSDWEPAGKPTSKAPVTAKKASPSKPSK